MNLAHFWQQVKELEADLPEVVFLVDNQTGRTSKADRKAAARALVEHGHIRQASDDEAAKFEQREVRRAELAKTIEALECKGIHIKTR